MTTVVLWTLGVALAGTQVWTGVTVHPVEGPVLEDAVIVFSETGIAEVGPTGSVVVPDGAEVRSLPGHHVIPGLIDLHSHIGGGRLHESLGQVQGGVSAIDAIDPTHVSIQRAQAGGITTANVMPGSGKLLGGQTAYLSLRDSAVVDDLLLCGESSDEGPLRRTAVCGGVKMANGTNPQGGGGDPKSRMGAAYLQRKALLEARERLRVQDEVEAAKAGSRRDRKRAPALPKPDLALDGLVEILRGERVVHFHSHRADDMVTAVGLAEEFGFRLVLHHGSEGFKVASRLVEAGIPVAINVLDTPGGKEETLERRLDNPALLHDAGVTVALITDDPVQDSRLFLRSGALAVRGGLPPEAALRALTLTPAELVGLDSQKGSLVPGKDADLVLLSGPPLSLFSHVQETWVGGTRVYDRSDPQQRVLAAGGDAAWPQLSPAQRAWSPEDE